MAGKNFKRRITLGTIGVLGLFALNAPAVSSVELPLVMNGQADSQALQVSIRLPSAAELRSNLIAAEYPVTAMPVLDIGATDQVIVVSLNHGDIARNSSGLIASGFAAPLLGSAPMPKSTTRCSTPACTDNSQSVAAARLDLPAPLDLGFIDVVGAFSETARNLETGNRTGTAVVSLNLEKLIGPDGPLAVVGDALETARAAINSQVVPAANGAIDEIKTTLDGVSALDPVRDELDRIISIDHIRDMPDLRYVNLVETKVLSGDANVFDELGAGKAVTGLLAKSGVELEKLSVLGDWITASSISVEAKAFANGVKGENWATTKALTDIQNADIAGLLGIHVSAADLARLLDSQTLKDVATDTATRLALTSQIENLHNTIDLVYNVAGVTMEQLPSNKTVSSAGLSAQAEANSLRLRIAPTIPNLTKLSSGGASVPALAASDYVPTGLSISIDLPSATAGVAASGTGGACVGPGGAACECIGSCVPTTGVEDHWMLGIGLLGLAVGVRRFALKA